jgi:hypothetical protein
MVRCKLGLELIRSLYEELKFSRSVSQDRQPCFPSTVTGLTPCNLSEHFLNFSLDNFESSSSTTVKSDQGGSGLVGSSLLSEPSRREWQEEHSAAQLVRAAPRDCDNTHISRRIAGTI